MMTTIKVCIHSGIHHPLALISFDVVKECIIIFFDVVKECIIISFDVVKECILMWLKNALYPLMSNFALPLPFILTLVKTQLKPKCVCVYSRSHLKYHHICDQPPL